MTWVQWNLLLHCFWITVLQAYPSETHLLPRLKKVRCRSKHHGQTWRFYLVCWLGELREVPQTPCSSRRCHRDVLAPTVPRGRLLQCCWSPARGWARCQESTSWQPSSTILCSLLNLLPYKGTTAHGSCLQSEERNQGYLWHLFKGSLIYTQPLLWSVLYLTIVSTFHRTNASWHLLFLELLNSVREGGGEHGGAVCAWRPAAAWIQTDVPYGPAGFGGHLLKPPHFSRADFITWGKSWFPWLMFAPFLGKHSWKFEAALSEVGFRTKRGPCSPWFPPSAVPYFSIQRA